MNTASIVAARLANQRLVGAPFVTPEQAISWFGAMQGQDFPAVTWALGLRVKNSDSSKIVQAFNEGKFLRVHSMRPTWHLVSPEDIRWMQMLTAPRVHAVNAYYYRQTELDDKTLGRCHEVLAKVLAGGKCLTRTEIKQALEAAGVSTHNGLRLGYMLIHAELEALICNGPIRGKQHTYALLEERVPKAKPLTRDEALAELTKRYFVSHGPAQVQDFAWWSGLALADIKRGIEMNQQYLRSEIIDSKTYWFADLPKPAIKQPFVQLLPNYDEYLIAYKDRDAYFHPAFRGDVNMLINHVVVMNGQVVGGWRRVLEKDFVIVQTKLMVDFSKKELSALQAETSRYANFLGKKAKLTVQSI